MEASSKVPDPNLIYGLSSSAYATHILRLALTVDVFTPLAGTPADTAMVARATGCNSAGIQALLDYLAARDLLVKRGNNYELTETAALFLVRGRRTYAGDFLLGLSAPRIWDHVLGALRGRRPDLPSLPWAQDAWLESYRADRADESRAMWQAAGIQPGDRPGLRVLDLGCGCAIKSLVLAEADASTSVTCVDEPEVLAVARDLAERMGVADQATFAPGDVHDVELELGIYDVVLIGQLTYYLAPGDNAELFGRVARTLVGGGMLVVDAIMTGDEPSTWASTVTLLALGTSRGVAYRVTEYRAWLETSGFRDVRQLGEHWLVATK